MGIFRRISSKVGRTRLTWLDSVEGVMEEFEDLLERSLSEDEVEERFVSKAHYIADGFKKYIL